ncbi:hypothetical protein QPK14_21365 [Photorhabdus temperata subsp. temperata]
MSIIVATLLAILVLAYWYVCRMRYLDEKEKLAQLTIDYLDNDAAPDSMRNMAYLMYQIVNKWWVFPLISLVSPFFMIFSPDSRITESEKLLINDGVTFQDVMNSAMLAYGKRNPIISFCCLLTSTIGLIIAILLKALFSGLVKIPNIKEIPLIAITSIAKVLRKAH